MSCFHPLGAWKMKKLFTENGKNVISFKDPTVEYSEDEAEGIKLPCGQCIGCRLERSRIWAARIMHEAYMYEDNCFITLTYNDKYLPKDESLKIEDFQKFMKRFRKAHKRQIRFFHCGEYGELCKICGKSSKNCRCTNFVPKLGRPHYHACIFNFDFYDKEIIKAENGNNLYVSEFLNKLWSNDGEPMGFCSIGELTFESAAYVARYVTKKINGTKAVAHYGRRRPEYITMSRGYGIGKKFYEEFKSEIYPADEIVIRGNIKCKPPKFYDEQLEKENPDLLKSLKEKRKEEMESNPDNFDKRRLCVKENLTLLTNEKLKRGMDNEIKSVQYL